MLTLVRWSSKIRIIRVIRVLRVVRAIRVLNPLLTLGFGAVIMALVLHPKCCRCAVLMIEIARD